MKIGPIAAFMVATTVSLMSAQTVTTSSFRVTLLGTGNPPPTLERFGPSILVEAAYSKPRQACTAVEVS